MKTPKNITTTIKDNYKNFIQSEYLYKPVVVMATEVAALCLI